MPIIALVAGEPSGDRLGAAMMREISAERPDIRFIGIGGNAMRQQGLIAIGHSDTLTLMGLDGIVSKLGEILTLRRRLLKTLDEQQPQLFIGIDAPDFNLEVERRLKLKGVHIGHYVAPSVWAWRQHRLPKIKAVTDFILGIYPFEEEWFNQHDIKVSYVGHPILDELAQLPEKAILRKERNIEDSQKVVALLIGSRKGEIKRMGPTLINVANNLINKGYRVLIPMVNLSLSEYLKEQVSTIHPDVEISIGDSREVLAIADIGIIKSGTSSLEAALLNTPHIVVYKASWLSYRWVKAKAVRKEAAMPNIMANEIIVPELLQDDMTENNINAALEALLTKSGMEKQQQAFARIYEEMHDKRSHSAAEIVLEQLALIEEEENLAS